MQFENRCEFTEATYIVVSSLISFYAPCLVMIYLYSIILKRLHERQKAADAKKRTKRAAATSSFVKSKDSSSPPQGTTTMSGLTSFGASAFGGHAAALLRSARLVREIGERLEAKGEADTTIDSLSTTNSSSDPDEDISARGSLRPDRSPVTVTTRPKLHSHSKHSNSTTHPHTPMVVEEVQKLFSDSPIAFTDCNNIIEEGSSSQNCPSSTDPPATIRSFGDDLELIPFIDSSRPGSVRQRNGGAPLPNLDSIEEFPTIKTPGSSFKNRCSTKQTILNSTFKNCSVKIKPVIGDDSVVVVERQTNTSFRESLRCFRRRVWDSLTGGFRLKRLKPTSKHVAKREHRQIRKERKATQTLAVVLAVFLVCWVPFFTCHLTNAICILTSQNSCIPFLAFFLTTWLGYMNSFMNPIIYTIFNPEYRKAFRKILLCWKRGNRS